MSDIAEEEGKHGVCDSEALEESLPVRDHLLILINNEGEEVSDIESKRILLKKGLAAEVSIPSVPSD
jgi:hypothetical protein